MDHEGGTMAQAPTRIKPTHRLASRWLAAVVVLAAACGSAPDADETAAAADTTPAAAPAEHATMPGDVTAEDRASIDQVTAATEQYRDFATAQAAGYTEQTPPGCMASAEGAQGIHYLKPTLVDDKTDLLTPELLMYEPQADGSMTLVGVDYMIPFDRWQSADPPTVLNRPLMRNEQLGVWALHIWNFRDNPNGMFAAWNPSVRCPQTN